MKRKGRTKKRKVKEKTVSTEKEEVEEEEEEEEAFLVLYPVSLQFLSRPIPKQRKGARKR